MRSEPVSTPAFDRVMIACCCWMIAGLYVDGWAHYHLPSARETFFTPWHAILYSGFAACAIALGVRARAGRARGLAWSKSLPKGYRVSALGVIIMAAGGLVDMLWHIFFGIETNIAAQLSPAHLVVAVGLGLIVSGPFFAAAAPDAGARRGLSAVWPAVVSLGLVLAVFELFTKSFHPFYIAWASTNVKVGIADAALTAQIAYLQQALGIASVVVQSAILMGLLLTALRRRLLPPGSVTIILGIGTALFDVSLLGAAIAAGILSDLELAVWKPAADRSIALRAFALSVPAFLYSFYYADVALTRGGIWWPAHLWVGSIALAGITGVLISFLAIPGDRAAYESALASSLSDRS